MDKIFEYIEKILKKCGDTSAYYVYSKEFRSSMDKPFYMVTISWTKKDLSPLRIAEYKQSDVLKELKTFYRKNDKDTLQKRYHLNQIDAGERVIKYHKDQIKGIEKPKKKAKK